MPEETFLQYANWLTVAFKYYVDSRKVHEEYKSMFQQRIADQFKTTTNILYLNSSKINEIVLTHLRSTKLLPPPLSIITQVTSVKILGVTLTLNPKMAPMLIKWCLNALDPQTLERCIN